MGAVHSSEIPAIVLHSLGNHDDVKSSGALFFCKLLQNSIDTNVLSGLKELNKSESYYFDPSSAKTATST